MTSKLQLLNEELLIPVARPPWTKLGKRLESQVRKALYDFQLLSPNLEPDVLKEGPIKIAIALSGGKDSLTLLFLLNAISGRGFPQFELYPIHVHGAFSCGAGIPLGFLKGICKKLDLQLILRESTQELHSLECYSCSRERRSFLFEEAKQIGAKIIAFGHHADDNAQTLLLNLLHKAEPSGMLPKVPMKNYGMTIIRPLIYCEEHDIQNFAKQNKFARVTCQCPVGQNSKRKKIAESIEKLSKEFPNTKTNLAHASLNWGLKKALSP